MHTRNTILNLLSFSAAVFVLTALAVSLFSCRGEEVIYPTIGTHVTDEVREGGLYILCEGNMGSNKARLDYMNLEAGDYYANWYGAQNPNQLKELGDVGNDIQQYGGKLYAVINCSHKVEVMDLKSRHIGKIDLPNCRYMAFKGDKMYVSAYVGSVADPDLLGSVYEIDTATLTVTREVKVGHQPDELCIVNDRLYVANSGGYLFGQYDSTLSVIDLNSFTQIDQIHIGLNPTRLRYDNNGHLWVGCQGNYMDVDPFLAIYDFTTVIKRIETPCTNLSIHDSVAYVLGFDATAIRAFSTHTFAEQAVPIDLSAYEHPYGLLVTDDAIFVTDAKNYVSSGVLHCYSYDGHLRWSAKTGDIPGHLCLINNAYNLYSDTTNISQ